MLIEQVGELRQQGVTVVGSRDWSGIGIPSCVTPRAGDPSARALLVPHQTRLVGVGTPF